MEVHSKGWQSDTIIKNREKKSFLPSFELKHETCFDLIKDFKYHKSASNSLLGCQLVDFHCKSWTVTARNLYTTIGSILEECLIFHTLITSLLFLPQYRTSHRLHLWVNVG